MDDGIFHQRLQDHLRYHTVLQLVRYLGFTQKTSCESDLLNLDITLNGLQLLPQGDKRAAGNALTKDHCQVLSQDRYLRDLIDPGIPLNGIQGIVEKMWI